MKKKTIILFVLVGLLLICSCGPQNPKEINLTYTENDFENISLYINDLDLTLDLSNDQELKDLLLSLKLYKNNSTVTVDQTSEYVLSFGNYEFTIYSYKGVNYIDNDNEFDAMVLNDEFNYLDELFEYENLNFNNYLQAEKIKVFNSKNDSAEITDKVDFLEKLTAISYIKLNKKEIFNLGDLTYKIEIDNETINIYDKYLVIGENLYILVEGNFSFLSSLKFSSSSGWLPWI